MVAIVTAVVIAAQPKAGSAVEEAQARTVKVRGHVGSEESLPIKLLKFVVVAVQLQLRMAMACMHPFAYVGVRETG